MITGRSVGQGLVMMVEPEAADPGRSAAGETRRSRRSSWLSGYWLILGLLVASYVFAASQVAASLSAVALLVQLVTVAVTLRVARVNVVIRRFAWIVLAVTGASAAVVALLGLSGQSLDVALSSASMIAYLVAPIAIVAHQSRKTLVDGQTLLASIAAYVMVGMFFTFLYNLLSLLSDAPLFGAGQVDTLTSQLFFSFTTLTTTGYGNLVPVSALVQSIAIVEAIAGQLFLVIAVARVVSGWRPPAKGRAS